ncbi:homeobox-domain-containing protein [Schizopora paradoxa]|uniref:Homeobox-domain-containing protein n=1 Tax=Schizopora paradoxa TaxID=27342 RepID=A0A0H2RYN1_9AGAM|nr:homeobox-domain-containing protein [Schizopora paradoxa]
MSPSRNDIFSPSFDPHWSSNHMMAGHHPYPYSNFDLDRYPTSSPQNSIPMRQSPPLQPLEHGVRRGPPLSIPHVQQDSGHIYPQHTNYGGFQSFAEADMHSPISSYPMQPDEYGYSSSYPPYPTHGSGYDPRHLPHPHLHLPSDLHSHRLGHANEWGVHQGRTDSHLVSPYARGPRDALDHSPQEPSPVDFPIVKKKRKRADAAQLKILNEVYNRTAFPTTEERMDLAKKLDMSARSVQIWFQNKRQASRQNRNSANTMPPMMHHPYNSAMPSSSNHPPLDIVHPTPHRGEISVSPASHGSYPSRSPGLSSSRGPREPSPRPPPPTASDAYRRGRSPADIGRSTKRPGSY